MDTPSPRSGSLFLPAIAVVAAIALIVAIIGLIQTNKLKKLIGETSVADLAVRVGTVEATAKKASDDANRVSTRITGLNTDTQRAFDQVGSELATLKTSVTKLTTDAQSLTDRLASGPVRSSGGSGATTGPAPGTLGDDGTYVIKSGDSLVRIGSQLGVPWQEIVKANPGINPNRLQVGQKIYIPQKP